MDDTCWCSQLSFTLTDQRPSYEEWNSFLVYRNGHLVILSKSPSSQFPPRLPVECNFCARRRLRYISLISRLIPLALTTESKSTDSVYDRSQGLRDQAKPPQSSRRVESQLWTNFVNPVLKAHRWLDK